ncbi:GntR family transcriptional regulator [Phycisphaerales bacterium AB-hyl4]|uniref:GntR family transcriptional regulator n=1 Tax=Natronomicrosphaera hydrolytica TaxID=3242702 RepID=A0ABV4U7G3_9BACT
MAQIVQGNKVPLYRQVASRIMQRIRTGDYKPGDALPSIRSISSEFKVSINVVQRALRELESKGMVVTQHGKQVLVADTARGKRAAIVFGMIHPYSGGLAFGRDVLYFAGQTFSDRSNLLFTVSSEGNAARERELAEHLVANGVRGLIVWPVESDHNAEFFETLARRVPTVLVDRIIPGCSLPAVIHDTHAAGRDICEQFLVRMKRRRLLVLADDLDISPYQSLLQGMRERVQELDRFADLTIVQLPLSETVGQFNRADFSAVKRFESYIERLIREDDYDSVFCYQDDFLDYVVIETGLIDRLPGVKFGCTRSAGVNTRSRRFVEADPIGWSIDHMKAISLAADRLQEWVLSKRPFDKVIQLEFIRHDSAGGYGLSKGVLGEGNGSLSRDRF